MEADIKTVVTENPEYGVIKFYKKIWGKNEDSKVTFEPLKTRACDKDEFHLQGIKSDFYELKTESTII